MKNKIEPIVVEGLNCIENTMLTVCNYLCGEYKKTFWNSWNVKYQKSYFSRKGFVVPKTRIENNLEKFYGIRFIPLDNVDKSELTSVLKRQLDKNGLAVIGIKTNCCPWQKSYRKREYSIHFLVATKLLQEGVQCVDTMPKKQDGFIDWEDILSGVSDVIQVERKSILGKSEDTENIQKDFFTKVLWKFIRKNVKPQTIKNLILDIQNKYELLYFLEKEHDIWRVPIYRQFFLMAGVHNQFEQFLLEYRKSYESTEFIAVFHSIIQEWEFLKLLIIKLHRDYRKRELTNEKLDETLEACKTFLLDITKKEEKAVRLFCQVGNMYDSFDKDTLIAIDRIVFEEQYVSLLYNEISHMVETEEFGVSACVPLGSTVKAKTLSYLFPPKQSRRGILNSLYCSRQRIEINTRLAKVGFIGYATYGKQFEYLTVEYEGNQTEKYGFALSDWMEEPLLNEEVIWTAQFKNKSPVGYDHKGKIVSVVIDLDMTKKCESIILPEQKEMHIFGMTIAVVAIKEGD